MYLKAMGNDVVTVSEDSVGSNGKVVKTIPLASYVERGVGFDIKSTFAKQAHEEKIAFLKSQLELKKKAFELLKEKEKKELESKKGIEIATHQLGAFDKNEVVNNLLLTEATLRHLSGADFNQLSQYGAKLSRDGSGYVTDYDRIVNAKFSSEGLPQGNITKGQAMNGMGDVWSDIWDGIEEGAEQAYEQAIKQIPGAVQQAITGSKPPGSVTVPPSTGVPTGVPTYLPAGMTRMVQGMDTKKLLLYGGIGVGALIALMLVLRATNK